MNHLQRLVRLRSVHSSSWSRTKSFASAAPAVQETPNSASDQPRVSPINSTSQLRCQILDKAPIFQHAGARDFYGTIRNVQSSPMKMNLVAKLIRRMSIGEALAQIQFCEKKAAKFIEMVLLDTHRRAVKRRADPLNLWVAESYVGKGHYIKGISYHGKGMHGVKHRYFAHYFLALREGKAPKKKKNIEDTWRYKTRLFIQAGPRSIPNAL